MIMRGIHFTILSLKMVRYDIWFNGPESERFQKALIELFIWIGILVTIYYTTLKNYGLVGLIVAIILGILIVIFMLPKIVFA